MSIYFSILFPIKRIGIRTNSPIAELIILLYPMKLGGNLRTQMGDTIAATNSLIQYTALARVTNYLL